MPWAGCYGIHIPQLITFAAVFVGLGHSVLAMSGEESLAQVYREIEHPKLANLKKAALVIFVYSMIFTSLVSFFAVMIIPDKVRPQYFENLIGGLAMNLTGPFLARLIFHVFVVVVGTLILAGRREHGHRGLERRAEPRFRRRRALRLVPPAAPALWNFAPDHQHGGDPADRDDPHQPGRRDVSRRTYMPSA